MLLNIKRGNGITTVKPLRVINCEVERNTGMSGCLAYVTSSARLDRLKLEAVEKTKTRYVGDYKEPYNQKSKTEDFNCTSVKMCTRNTRFRKI